MPSFSVLRLPAALVALAYVLAAPVPATAGPGFFTLPGTMMPAANPVPTPEPVTEITASTRVNGNQVSIDWVATGVAVRDQEIYRHTQAELNGRVRIASLNGTARRFTDTNLAPGTYYYTVKVRDTALQVSNSNAARAVVAGDNPGDELAFDAEVFRNGDAWTARNGNNVVYRGGDMLDAMQAAVDSLTPGRTRKETVLVRDSGVVGPHVWDGDVKSVDLPSYTVLDVRGTIRVEDSGDDTIVPIRAMRAKAIEIRNLKIEGNPRYGIWIQSSSDVQLGHIEMLLHATRTVGLGIRIDHAKGPRSSKVRLDYARIEGSKHHGVETYGVDDLVIGNVVTVDTGGSGLILNDTSNARVGSVHATRPSVNGGGYAGLRLANNAGPDIRVDQVTVRGGARGVFCVSGSHGITVDRVDIEGTGQQGILIEDCQSVSINGGSVRNSNAEGVRIASRTSNEHRPSSNNTLQNLRITDDRSNPVQPYGIRETAAGGTSNNRILNNDLRNAGTVTDLATEAPGTRVSGNRLTGQ